MDVEIRMPEREFRRAMDHVIRDQIPFASSLALNNSIKDAMGAVLKAIPGNVTIRNKGILSRRRWREVRSTKRQWPKLEAAIGSLDEFWNLQERGGIKRPERGKTLAIPTRLVRPNEKRAIRKSNRPSELFPAGKARATPTEFRAVRKRRRRKDQREILYLRRKSARIKPRLGATDAFEGEVRRVYDRRFREALEIALRSRRVRGGSFTQAGGRAAFLEARRRVLRAPGGIGASIG